MVLMRLTRFFAFYLCRFFWFYLLVSLSTALGGSLEDSFLITLALFSHQTVVRTETPLAIKKLDFSPDFLPLLLFCCFFVALSVNVFKDSSLCFSHYAYLSLSNVLISKLQVLMTFIRTCFRKLFEFFFGLWPFLLLLLI